MLQCNDFTILPSKAFILAHARQAYSDLSPRLRSLYFFGTPHRGSQVTTNFRRLFKIVPYVSPTENISDIDPTSRLLESLNQDFPQICQNIEIRSYFEKEKSLILPEPDYIVPKHSAALNYKNETLDGLDADHRGMCKFQRLSDPNFQQVRNALLSTVDSIIIKISKENRVEHTETLKHLRDYLGVRDVPEDDLLDNQDHCLQHDSCAWFTSSKKYVLWRDSPTQSVHTSASNRCNLMMVIEGDPGAGKSVLSSQIINNLQGLNYECSYYFLISQGKFRVGGLLRSLAYQMALLSPVVRQAIIDLKQEDVQLQVEDDRLVWRRLFVNCIFRCKIDRPQYWVIDGLDECGNAKSLTQMLSKIEAGTPFKVLLTTRPANEIRSELAALDGKFTHIPLTEADTRLSIRDYVEARSRRMGLRKENHRLTLVKKIMDRSNRNFLWVRLVMDEKEKASGPKEILQSLDEEIPKGMNSLYKRIVEQLEDETPTKQKPILKAVLEWVVCSNPMLSVDELEAAILLDTEEEIYASKMCDLSRNLIRIDQGKKVHMVHSTARQYLLKEARESKFAVNSAEANLRLASTLIKHLQRSLRPVKSAAQLSITIRQESGIRNYAVSNFSDHMRRASSEDVMLLLDVERFLSSQGLTWISHVASTGLLQHLCPRQVHLLACPC